MHLVTIKITQFYNNCCCTYLLLFSFNPFSCLFLYEPALDKTNKITCAKRRLRSTWADAQSDQSSQCPPMIAKGPMFLHADNEDWSDWADAQADLRLCWAYNHFVGFVMLRLILFK